MIVFVVAGVFGCERDGGRARDGGICAVQEDGRIREGGLVNTDDWVMDGIEDWAIGDHGREEDIYALDMLLL